MQFEGSEADAGSCTEYRPLCSIVSPPNTLPSFKLHGQGLRATSEPEEMRTRAAEAGQGWTESYSPIL